jgi:hypothetical protein
VNPQPPVRVESTCRSPRRRSGPTWPRALWVRWQGVRAQLDPLPGGACEIEMPDGTIASGQVLEVDHPRRLVFSLDPPLIMVV